MTDPQQSPPAPRFGARGAAFWHAVTTEFEPDEGEAAVLVEVCRTLDALDELDAAVARDGVTVAGSMGQPVVHPAVGEARQQRATLARLLRALDLDVEAPAPGASARSESASHAARERWRQEKVRRGVGA